MIDVFAQGYEAALLFCIGIGAGLLFALLNRIGGKRGLFRHVCDLLFVVLSAALLLFGTLIASDGIFRGFYVLCFTTGAIVSAWAFWPLFAEKLQKIRK